MWPFKRKPIVFEKIVYRDRPRVTLRALELNYPVGTEILLQGNEPGPLVVGRVVGYDEHTNSGEWHLIFKNLANGKILFTFDDNPHVFTQQKYDILVELEWWQRWNLLCIPLHGHLSEEDARRKEEQWEKRGILHPDILT